ncbi:putative germin-like protein 2-3 [Phtheirospermum japonicum]|uniref:Putative germin-like protein 2-3 n=1 Tax=Phtheirospermum japonicum TaxID=374723 RepID=A0A830BXY1_9LAMI|nr:putative germin-like protein 2-3 [Phtheirospermum japonicum]
MAVARFLRCRSHKPRFFSKSERAAMQGPRNSQSRRFLLQRVTSARQHVEPSRGRVDLSQRRLRPGAQHARPHPGPLRLSPPRFCPASLPLEGN